MKMIMSLVDINMYIHEIFISGVYMIMVSFSHRKRRYHLWRK